MFVIAQHIKSQAELKGGGRDGGKRVDSNLEELVGGGGDDRNYKGMAISIFVILGILGLIVSAVIIITPVSYTVEKFTFDDIFDPSLIPKRYDVDWLTGDTYIRKGEHNNILISYLNSNETDTLITNRTVEETDSSKYWVNANQQYVLMGCSVKKLYRHSFTAVYKIYNMMNKKVLEDEQLKPNGMQDNTRLQYASWAPAGTGLVFVYGNNIYYQEALGKPSVKLTDTGEEGNIFNGIPDWVYEEEMLDSNNAIYWGPESTNLAYATFNDTEVKRAWYPDYNNNIYSKVQRYPYPKAGETNPTVTLYVQDLQGSNNERVWLKPPKDIREIDHYYQSVTWIDKYKVAVVWINRPQNYSVTTICQVDTGECLRNHDYTTSNGWVVLRGPPVFSESGQSYVYIFPRKETGIGNYYHIALQDVMDPDSLNITDDNSFMENDSAAFWKPKDRIFLTQGTWEVTEILAYNETARVVYYMSTETSPHDRHLYNVSIDPPHRRTCLSCDVREDCSYFSTSFSKDLSWYQLHCLGPGIPQVTFHNMHTGEVYMAEANEELTDRLDRKAYPEKEIREVVLEDGHKIHIQLWKPSMKQFDVAREHPLLIDVYGGPGSQKVNNKFELGWNAYLSSRYYVIVASIDGRGAGFYGENNLYAINRQLGTVEIEDQIKGAEYLAADKMIDANKIGIWGWSYGGFATTSVLGRGMDLFKCGMAVAPITDWRYYDSIYTERYMGLPTQLDNLQAYKNSNVSALAHKLKNSRLLLIHGTADDNVHFQNSADLVRSLVQEEIPHQTQYYPDERNVLESTSHRTQLHRLHLMINHLEKYLDLPPIV